MSFAPEPETCTTSYRANHGHRLIGDGRTTAVIAANGTIAWLCWPHFDSPSVFGARPDGQRGGFFRITAIPHAPAKQLYVSGTGILIARYLSHGGIGEVQDFMPAEGPQAVIRRARCVCGTTRFRVECEPRFNSGRDKHATAITAQGATFRSPSLTLTLRTSVPLEPTPRGVLAEFELHAGKTASFVLTERRESDRLTEAAVQILFDKTVAYWQEQAVGTPRPAQAVHQPGPDRLRASQTVPLHHPAPWMRPPA